MLVEEVFVRAGVPKVTFVQPSMFDQLRIALRTPGLPVILEGPSGIGKTTAVRQALEALGLAADAQWLRCRLPREAEIVKALPGTEQIGTFIIDDFHRLAQDDQERLSDHMKIVADAQNEKLKIVLIGINSTGKTLMRFSPDLALRLEILKMHTDDEDAMNALLSQGEAALNIKFSNKEEISREAMGSFQICQLLALYSCTEAKINETQSDLTEVNIPIERVRKKLMSLLTQQWQRLAMAFACGPSFSSRGRAPYLTLLKWLSEDNDWTLDVRAALERNPQERGSVGQVVDRGYLEKFVNDANDRFADFISWSPHSEMLSIESPQAYFYLRNQPWTAFARSCGFRDIEFAEKYDFALSFGPGGRDLARAMAKILVEHQLSVFFDEDFLADSLGEDIEQYLGPIYRDESKFVIPIITSDYPDRV